MDPWIKFIGNVGFPIVVTFYLLVRLEKNFSQLEQMVEKLIQEIQRKK